jgi:hypothetical protein
VASALQVCWEIWKERNVRIFERKESPKFKVQSKIKEEAKLWAAVGA